MKKKLIENIIWQADYFLKECGEFYPFATVIDANGELKPLGILLKEEKPSPEQVIAELNIVLSQGKIEGIYKEYAIGINISLYLGEGLRKDAIEIRLSLEKGKELKNTLSEAIPINQITEIYQVPYYLNIQTREIDYEDLIKK